jgi:hypothetical protein
MQKEWRDKVGWSQNINWQNLLTNNPAMSRFIFLFGSQNSICLNRKEIFFRLMEIYIWQNFLYLVDIKAFLVMGRGRNTSYQLNI